MQKHNEQLRNSLILSMALKNFSPTVSPERTEMLEFLKSDSEREKAQNILK